MLNPMIPMAGQAPDIIGNMSRGVQTGQQMQEAQTQNSLRDLYQTQGAGILAGDQGSLNALAQMGPQGAAQAMGVQTNRLGMEQTQLGMDATRQNMQMQVEQVKRDTERYAAGLTAQQRAAEADQLERSISGAAFFHAQGDRAGYDRFLTQQNLDPAQYPFDDYPAQAAMFGGALEVLKGFQPQQPEFRPASAEEAAAYGAAAGQFNTQTGKFDPMNPPSGMSIQSDGAGGFSMVQGPGAGNKPLTEGQSKDAVFATRAEGALATLDPIADSLTSLGMRAAEYDPTGFSRRTFQDADFQVAKTAGDEFLQAILRKDTGAAITKPEQDLYGVTYLPQPGDGPEQLTYKTQARRRAVEAIKAGMPASAIIAQEKALAASGSPRLPPVSQPGQSLPPQGVQDQSTGPWPIDNDPPPEGFDAATWQWLRPEERDMVRPRANGAMR